MCGSIEGLAPCLPAELGKDNPMKCPVCWSPKAYARRVEGLRGILLSCLLIVPMKCHHCFHRFCVFRLFTLGQSIKAPSTRIAPLSRFAGPSHAAKQYAASQARAKEAESKSLDTPPDRAKAA